MQSVQHEIDRAAEALVRVLDDDVCYVQATLERLDRIRGAVVKRDEEDLRSQIELAETAREEYEIVEERRQGLREEFSHLLRCPLGEVNITRICQYVDGSTSEDLRERQVILRDLVEKMQHQQDATVRLLRECVRFNQLLLGAIFGNKREAVTYNSSGNSQWEMQQRLVNFKL